jgi:hypothetical protein
MSHLQLSPDPSDQSDPSDTFFPTPAIRHPPSAIRHSP